LESSWETENKELKNGAQYQQRVLRREKKVAFSVRQTAARQLLQKWKGLKKKYEKGKNFYSARATCFSC